MSLNKASMTCDVSHLGVHEVRAMRYPAFPLQPQAHSSRALRAKPRWSCDPVTAASWAPSGPLRPTKKRRCKSVYCAEMKGTQAQSPQILSSKSAFSAFRCKWKIFLTQLLCLTCNCVISCSPSTYILLVPSSCI